MFQKKIYACRSPRTNEEVLTQFAKEIGYKVVLFDAFDASGKAIYHTNVVMCIGDGFVVIGMCSVTNEKEREELLKHFKEDNLEVIDLTSDQLNKNMGGNMLQVRNSKNERFLVMSDRAYQSLSIKQLGQIMKYNNDIIHSKIYLIEEIGGGSARCTMAEIFLPKK